MNIFFKFYQLQNCKQNSEIPVEILNYISRNPEIQDEKIVNPRFILSDLGSSWILGILNSIQTTTGSIRIRIWIPQSIGGTRIRIHIPKPKRRVFVFEYHKLGDILVHTKIPETMQQTKDIYIQVSQTRLYYQYRVHIYVFVLL